MLNSCSIPIRPRWMSLLTALCLTMPSVVSAQTAANPLLSPSPLPYELPPFEQIRDDHFLPAFDLGMAEAVKEVEAIANNPAPPTFENTIVAMERSERPWPGRTAPLVFSRAATPIRIWRSWTRLCPRDSRRIGTPSC